MDWISGLRDLPLASSILVIFSVLFLGGLKIAVDSNGTGFKLAVETLQATVGTLQTRITKLEKDLEKAREEGMKERTILEGKIVKLEELNQNHTNQLLDNIEHKIDKLLKKA